MEKNQSFRGGNNRPPLGIRELLAIERYRCLEIQPRVQSKAGGFRLANRNFYGGARGTTGFSPIRQPHQHAVCGSGGRSPYLCNTRGTLLAKNPT